MKKSFAIIFDPLNKSLMDGFEETIRSNYISKKAKENMYIIVVDNVSSPKEIFENLRSKLDPEISFLVIDMSAYYGLFKESAIVWLKEQLPSTNWVE